MIIQPYKSAARKRATHLGHQLSAFRLNFSEDCYRATCLACAEPVVIDRKKREPRFEIRAGRLIEAPDYRERITGEPVRSRCRGVQ